MLHVVIIVSDTSLIEKSECFSVPVSTSPTPSRSTGVLKCESTNFGVTPSSLVDTGIYKLKIISDNKE